MWWRTVMWNMVDNFDVESGGERKRLRGYVLTREL